MAIVLDGSTDYLISDASFDSSVFSDGASEWSWHCWLRSPNAATTGNSPVWRFENAGLSVSTGYVWDGTVGPNLYFYRDSGSNYRLSDLIFGEAANTWYAKGGRFYFSNALTRCLIGVTDGGTFGGASCGSAWPSGTGNYLYIGGEGTNFFEGEIEHLAFWNVELTNKDFLALGKGISPLLIRPENLIWYFPFLDGRQEVISGMVTTENGSPIYTGSSDIRHIPARSVQVGFDFAGGVTTVDMSVSAAVNASVSVVGGPSIVDADFTAAVEADVTAVILPYIPIAILASATQVDADSSVEMVETWRVTIPEVNVIASSSVSMAVAFEMELTAKVINKSIWELDPGYAYTGRFPDREGGTDKL